jgi:hypothetical protein
MVDGRLLLSGVAINMLIDTRGRAVSVGEQVRNLMFADRERIVLGGQLDVQAGDFDNDGYPELVISFVDMAGQLRLYQWDMNIQGAVWGFMAKTDRTDRTSCGCFANEAVFLELFGEAKRINLPAGAGGGMPTASDDAATASPDRLMSPGFSYALAVGDVGLGFDVVRPSSSSSSPPSHMCLALSSPACTSAPKMSRAR